MKQVEKAAEKYALECQREEGYPSPMYDSYDAKEMRECAFKSGAEWQASQIFEANKVKPKTMCLRDKSKVCNLCHDCDVYVLNPNY